MPITRTRSLPYPSNVQGQTIERWRDYALGVPPAERGVWVLDEQKPSFSISGAGTQTTVSEGHPWNHRKRGFQGDIGGEFTSSRSYFATPFEGRGGKIEWTVSGPPFPEKRRMTCPTLLAVNPSGLPFPSSITRSNAYMDALGATAVARCSPTNSIADAATFLGELVKDGLPNLPGMRLWKGKIRLLADAGDEFLNATFGWLPLLSDVKSHAEAVQRSHAVMKQYERDAGKMVRRRYDFPTDEPQDSSSTYATNTVPYYGPYKPGGVPGAGTVVRTVRSVRKAWFSGAFTYHLPAGYASGGLAANAEAAKKLFGVKLSPETLWELTPWSWAVDWFTNAGDVIHNLSSMKQYGLVMPYGYVMEHSMTQHIYSWTETAPITAVTSYSPVSDVILVSETKTRRKANPFGFGITWEGLSPLQTAIAAALGLSRT